MKNIFLFFLIVVIASCNPKKVTTDAVQEERPVNLCYKSQMNNDNVALTVYRVNNKITGQLTYNLYEKDRNQGTIDGEMRGDTLLAKYAFTSEGIYSVREVAFLKRGKDLLEGFGETENVQNKMRFKQRDALTFGKSIVLTEEDCERGN